MRTLRTQSKLKRRLCLGLAIWMTLMTLVACAPKNEISSSPSPESTNFVDIAGEEPTASAEPAFSEEPSFTEEPAHRSSDAYRRFGSHRNTCTNRSPDYYRGPDFR